MQLPAKSKRQNAGSPLEHEPALVDQLRATIRRDGPMTFARFMEQALYHPQHGYYSAGRNGIGRRGDYYTSVSVGPLFGRLLAAHFAELWHALERPNEFTIVEQGAHDGAFARDVFQAAQQHHADLFDALRYLIVEPFPILQARQIETLAHFREKMRWHQSLDELAPFRGVHFSNELIDAMPVHLVRWNGAEWRERHVALRDDEFVLVDLPLSQAELAEQLRKVPFPFVAAYETEIRLAALEWIEAVSAKLTQGFVLAVDYGFAREELFAPQRTTGTLRSFAQHRRLDSPFAAIGRADLTAHVEWTSLTERAERCGLRASGFADQHHFITGLLAGRLGQEFSEASDPKTRRALQTLLHPNFLGMNFQFLELSKDVSAQPLDGFRFARDPQSALGLTR